MCDLVGSALLFSPDFVDCVRQVPRMLSSYDTHPLRTFCMAALSTLQRMHRSIVYWFSLHCHPLPSRFLRDRPMLCKAQLFAYALSKTLSRWTLHTWSGNPFSSSNVSAAIHDL